MGEDIPSSRLKIDDTVCSRSHLAGPHCNATDKAAAQLARLERPVKKMIGGAIGWVDEGFDLVAS